MGIYGGTRRGAGEAAAVAGQPVRQGRDEAAAPQSPIISPPGQQAPGDHWNYAPITPDNGRNVSKGAFISWPPGTLAPPEGRQVSSPEPLPPEQIDQAYRTPERKSRPGPNMNGRIRQTWNNRYTPPQR